MIISEQTPLTGLFNNTSGLTPPRKEKLYPVSFRVTASEKQQLKHVAGKQSLSSYVRSELLDNLAEDDNPHSRRHVKQKREPSIDAVEIARLLGMFGQSEIATSMLALSLAAQAGALEVTPQVEGKLERACDDLHEMKIALITALNVKPKGVCR